MTVEQFNIQSATSDILGIIIATLIMLAFGVVLLVTRALLPNRLKLRQILGGRVIGTKIGLCSVDMFLAFLRIILIVLSGFLCVMISSSVTSVSVVTIGSGYMDVKADFIGSRTLSNRGNVNVTSQEIAIAFVGQIGSDDFTLHKQYGANYGDTNVGRYTLGNGAKAYLVTTNSTSLIIELTNGEYLIVGTEDTQTLADSFSQNVYQLTP